MRPVKDSNRGDARVAALGLTPASRFNIRCGVGWLGCEDGTVFVAYDQAWMDQSSSWWAKANRAKGHIDSLSRLVDEFRALGPYSLTAEPTEKAGRLAYRLRFSTLVPVAVSTTVGDVLHNLRAALESLAFEVARRQSGRIFDR